MFQYQTHTIRIGTSDSFYQLVFNDVMGLEEGTERGVRAEDVKLAMMGHVKDGYKVQLLYYSTVIRSLDHEDQ